MDQGYNLELCGFDAYPIQNDIEEKSKLPKSTKSAKSKVAKSAKNEEEDSNANANTNANTETEELTIEDHYLDSSKPFGHELVLYTMLTINPENYPWRKYKTEDF